MSLAQKYSMSIGGYYSSLFSQIYVPSFNQKSSAQIICLLACFSGCEPQKTRTLFYSSFIIRSRIWNLLYFCWSLTSTSRLTSISASFQLPYTHPDIQCCLLTVQKPPPALHSSQLQNPSPFLFLYS